MNAPFGLVIVYINIVCWCFLLLLWIMVQNRVCELAKLTNNNFLPGTTGRYNPEVKPLSFPMSNDEERKNVKKLCQKFKKNFKTLLT